MAIFTNKSDASLPALTQFYQVTVWPRDADETDLAYGRRLLTTPAGEELRIWVVRVAGLNEAESEGRLPSAFLTAHTEISLKAGEAFPVSVFLKDSPRSGEEFMAWLSGLHAFLTKLMRLAADSQVPSREEVSRLNELLARYTPPKIVWQAAFETSGPPEVWIGEDAVDFHHPDLKAVLPFIGATESLEDFIGRLLVKEFYRALTRRQLDRCGTCQSVFWKENPKAISCSRRCASRQSQRLWKKRRSTGNRQAL